MAAKCDKCKLFPDGPYFDLCARVDCPSRKTLTAWAPENNEDKSSEALGHGSHFKRPVRYDEGAE